jgi:Tfp pilus assembly protein PilV
MKRSPSQMNSFFVEIIIVILFFAISVAVTLQLFVAANNRAQQSRDLSIAVIKAENIAEQVKSLPSAEAVPKVLQTAQRIGPGNGSGYRMGYDKQWNPTVSNPRYVIDVTLEKTKSKSGTMVVADISIHRMNNSGSKGIYTLSSAKYLPMQKS